MRAPALVLLALGALLSLGFGCGKSNSEPAAAGNAGLMSLGSAGAGSAGGGVASAGGGAGSAGGGVASASGEAGAGEGLLECDPGKVLCKRAAPQCVFGEVPNVVEGCYGECVKVERCACSTAAQCPEPEQYTCWSKRHCGPFVH